METTRLLGLPCRIEESKDTVTVHFPFNLRLKDEIKAMDGAKWNPDSKAWSFKASNRNYFRLQYLEGLNPYAPYDSPLKHITTTRPVYSHQLAMADHTITRRHCLIAAEMGTGKTLAEIESMEWAAKNESITKWLWVAPKSALYAVEMEFKKWKSFLSPDYVTYESLKHKMFNDYQGVIFDECSKLKNPTAQRSKMALDLSELIRNKYQEKGSYVVLMSGTPAPHDPANWWSIAEIACPGYFREGTLMKFKNRLGLIENVESMTGGNYPRLVTWWDDENKCKVCGKYEKDGNHDLMSGGHIFVKSINEIKELNNRMKGLTIVLFKKDCLELPEKIYRVIECKPTAEMLRAGKLIASSKGAAQALILLRELSDGFQYREVESNEIADCPICRGTGRYDIPEPGPCPTCEGTGKTKKVTREAVYVDTPKDKALQELLEEFDERIVIYGGFQGTIDKVIKIVTKAGWKYVKADGRGWSTNLEGCATPQEMLWAFQENEINGKTLDCPIAFIGQPGAAGMGLTLTASEAVVYFSNDFNAESRIQSEDRIHRPGCKGANIIDLVCLPSDSLILENLKKKKELQTMSMEELAEAFKS